MEEILKHRDKELEQFKNRFEKLKIERDQEILLMENIILELQIELFVSFLFKFNFKKI